MSLSDPTFVAEEVIHFCVPNLPATVARTSSHALTNALQPYLLRMAECGLECALGELPALYQGVKMYRGKIASLRLARSLGREVEIDMAAVVDQAK
jgi:alanine dehydrogenase